MTFSGFIKTRERPQKEGDRENEKGGIKEKNKNKERT
jgi:hypothetical protein